MLRVGDRVKQVRPGLSGVIRPGIGVVTRVCPTHPDLDDKVVLEWDDGNHYFSHVDTLEKVGENEI
jgi:hypothetical protein